MISVCRVSISGFLFELDILGRDEIQQVYTIWKVLTRGGDLSSEDARQLTNKAFFKDGVLTRE